VTKHAKTVVLVAIGALEFVILVFTGRDLILKRQETIDCGDGARRRIDIRDFTTQYSAYQYVIHVGAAD